MSVASKDNGTDPTSIVLFGDEGGLPALLEAVPGKMVRAIVVASNRPQSLQPAEQVGIEYGVPLLVQPDANDLRYPDFAQQLLDARPDLIFVYSYSMILKREILNMPRLGALNVHGSLLPRYRGANALNWVLINGEQRTGVTIHYMDEGVDKGDIVAQAEVPIDGRDTAVTLREKMMAVARDLLTQHVPSILAGTNSRVAQDESLASYMSRRRPEDGLIDWDWPDHRIYNLIRALIKPWPGAFYYHKDGQKIILDQFLELEEVRRLREIMNPARAK